MVTILEVTVQVAHLSVIGSFLLQVVANLILDVIEIAIYTRRRTFWHLFVTQSLKTKIWKVVAIVYQIFIKNLIRILMWTMERDF